MTRERGRRGATAVVLAGDVGGTHTRLCLVSDGGRQLARAVLDSHQYTSLELAAREFLDSISPKPHVVAAAFGVAGPVINGKCATTNLPWVVDEKMIAGELAIRHVTLINDLVALSLGVLMVSRSKLHPLGGARVPKRQGANLAVIAAGTGLGEGVLVWDGARFVPSATEGGHADFGPRDELEVDLLRFLRERFGHVSFERVLSGDGLGNLYDFFRMSKLVRETPKNVRAIEAAKDRNVAIARLGIERKSDAAARAAELFASIYGAEAGNLALKTLALGGVYVCGGIAPKILPLLDTGGFQRAFLEKGRMRSLMEKIPVAVVMDTDVGLAGAARVALAAATQ